MVFFLALDEIEDIRMIHPEDAHIGAPSGPSLLDRLCSGIENLHEGDRTARDPLGRTDDVILRPDPGEREPGPAAALLNQRHLFDGIEDLFHRIPDRKNKTGGELLEFSPRIHQGGGIRHEIEGGHQREEGFFCVGHILRVIE